MKIGTNPCNRRRDGKAPCSKHALAHATIEGLLAWYSHVTRQEGLPHWPAAVAWWQSRLQLVGPQQETELLFFPASEQSGLHRVHPTWAGTFVAVFPGINFILLDSDCPVTLFEAANLWKEGYLARFPSGTGRAVPTKHPLHRKQVYHSDLRVVYTQHRVDENRVGQGVLSVTEPHSELNAGFVVVFGSSHPPLFQWEEWTHLCRGMPEEHIKWWLPRRKSWKTCFLLG